MQSVHAADVDCDAIDCDATSRKTAIMRLMLLHQHSALSTSTATRVCFVPHSKQMQAVHLLRVL